MPVIVRPLTSDNVEQAREVQLAAFRRFDDEEQAAPSEQSAERQRRRYAHFLKHDPDGSWVAEIDGEIAGVALALRRGNLWGLSLLAVDPRAQNRGVGKQLLDATLGYADGVPVAVILSSRDPRAMRRYATAGFDLHPQIAATGQPRPQTLPACPRVRAGSADDAELADSVDVAVRGASRGPDHELLAHTWPMFAVDDVDGRGYAYCRDDGEVEAIAATDDATATTLLWRCLAMAHGAAVEASIWHLAGNQQWAVRVAVEAGLVLKPTGPVFWRGAAPPPNYLPSGPFL